MATLFDTSAAAAVHPGPPLKWAGGKRWQLPHLAPLWSAGEDRRLVEPFCGGLAVALGLRPRRALLNDVNPHLFNLYVQLKHGLDASAIDMRNDESCYYDNRTLFNDLIKANEASTAEAAGLFYYLNRTGFNGLCRFNASGGYNVPFGKYKSINYKRDFSEYQAAFAAWEFTNSDFERIDLEPGDFLYADPPYDVPFTTYSAGGFDWSDQQRAATWLSRHDGPVVLSNQATGRIIELYSDLGFALQYLDAPRRISCTGDRAPAKEVLATRNLKAVAIAV